MERQGLLYHAPAGGQHDGQVMLRSAVWDRLPALLHTWAWVGSVRRSRVGSVQGGGTGQGLSVGRGEAVVGDASRADLIKRQRGAGGPALRPPRRPLYGPILLPAGHCAAGTEGVVHWPEANCQTVMHDFGPDAYCCMTWGSTGGDRSTSIAPRQRKGA